jgi:adenylate cyclase
MRPAEIVQLVLALLIPSYLTVHALGTGWLHRCCGLEDSYHYYLNLVWPGGARSQTILTLTVWLHAMIGLHHWLRLRPGYRPLQPWLLVAATLLPVLALAGFVSAGREVTGLRTSDPNALAALAATEQWADDALRTAMVFGPEAWIVRGFFALVMIILLLRTIRWLWLRRREVQLAYPGGRRVSVPRGLTILEASRLAGVPHASVCGGRGRCSTCRVRVGQGAERLPPPSATEQRVLARIGAPPDVRLACQTRLAGNLALTPLMPATAGPAEVVSLLPQALGGEREIAVLFCDLRGFTSLSEGRLPYDTVFILNRYFKAMGEVVVSCGGRVDKFIGDGIMALFGVEGDAAAAARSALAATRGMVEALDTLNQDLAIELDAPLRMGIGLHLGPVILGEMGHGPATSLTAIGDTVNIASRLETLTKDLACLAAISAQLVERAGVSLPGAEAREVDLRGRTGRQLVWLVTDATELPTLPGIRRPRPWLGRLGPYLSPRFLGLTERAVRRANSGTVDKERPSPP